MHKRIRSRGNQRQPRGSRRPGARLHRPAQRVKKGAAVFDELKEEAIVNKVGGRFKLSTLIQKRLVALQQGARPLVEVRGGDRMAIVIQEILQDKIYLDTDNQVQSRGVSAAEVARRAMLGDVSGSMGSDD